MDVNVNENQIYGSLLDGLNDIEAKTSMKKDENPCATFLYLPKAVYFIVVTELFERFTYYGFRAILILYLTQHLLLKDVYAVSLYHFFICMCYFTAIIGSFISDNFLGKYKTLVIAAAIYTVGSTLLSLTSLPARSLSGAVISLTLIAFGTGGVKACVAPFGGDQIPSDKKVALDSFFSMFYFAINFGAMVSTIVTPVLRAEVACNRSDDCYPLAFGIPAVLMGTALIIFILGRPFYIEVPVKENIYAKAVRCIYVSIKTWYRERHVNKKDNLLDYAEDKYNPEFISDLRKLYRIAILFLPLPAYWALFEQMGSRWTLQATQMDGEISPYLIILPDQMFIFNVFMVVILIVVFNVCIYPISYRFSPTLRPLRRMTIGFMFTVLAFFAASLLQKHMENVQAPKLVGSMARVVLINGQQCDVSMYVADGRFLQASSYHSSLHYIDIASGLQEIQFQISKCGSMAPSNFNRTVKFSPLKMNFIIISTDTSNSSSIRIVQDFRGPNIKGYSLIRLTVASGLFENFQFQLKNAISGKIEKRFTVIDNGSLFVSKWNKLSKPGRYQWSVKFPLGYPINESSIWKGVYISGKSGFDVNPLKIVSSEVSIFYMTFSNQRGHIIAIPLTLHRGSQVSILWQLPQYFLMSIGEVLVNIPGLTFSYDQAPLGMKSLVNAMWYMCDAFGNVIVMIVANLRPGEKQSLDFLIFAIICIVFNVIFGVVAYYYPMQEREEYMRI